MLEREGELINIHTFLLQSAHLPLFFGSTIPPATPVVLSSYDGFHHFHFSFFSSFSAREGCVNLEPKTTQTLMWSLKELKSSGNWGHEINIPSFFPSHTPSHTVLWSPQQETFHLQTPHGLALPLLHWPPKASWASQSEFSLFFFLLEWLLCCLLSPDFSPKCHFLIFQPLGCLSGCTNLQVFFLLVVFWPCRQCLPIGIPRIKIKVSQICFMVPMSLQKLDRFWAYCCHGSYSSGDEEHSIYLDSLTTVREFSLSKYNSHMLRPLSSSTLKSTTSPWVPP